MTDEEKREFKCLKEKIELNKLYGISIYLTKEQVKIIENLFKENNDKKWENKIKAKIEEFKQVRDEILREEKEFNRPMMTYDLKRNDYCEKMLQSLLEEE